MSIKYHRRKRLWRINHRTISPNELAENYYFKNILASRRDEILSSYLAPRLEIYRSARELSNFLKLIQVSFELVERFSNQTDTEFFDLRATRYWCLREIFHFYRFNKSYYNSARDFFVFFALFLKNSYCNANFLADFANFRKPYAPQLPTFEFWPYSTPHLGPIFIARDYITMVRIKIFGLFLTLRFKQFLRIVWNFQNSWVFAIIESFNESIFEFFKVLTV